MPLEPAPGVHSSEVSAQLQQCFSRVDHGVAHQRGLVRVRHRQRARRLARDAVHRERHGQRAGEFIPVELPGGKLSRSGQDAKCDRQVEAARFLWQVGWSEVDRDAPVGDLDAGVLDSVVPRPSAETVSECPTPMRAARLRAGRARWP
jgi:hypothetical protein